MSSELSILALYGLFVLIVVAIQVTMAMGQVGLPMLVSPRDNMPVLTGTAGRMERAVRNSVTAMAIFAPAILILALRDGFSSATLLAAQVFLIARIIYVLVYALGTPWLRTGIWALGFLATAYLYLLAL